MGQEAVAAWWEEEEATAGSIRITNEELRGDLERPKDRWGKQDKQDGWGHGWVERGNQDKQDGWVHDWDKQ